MARWRPRRPAVLWVVLLVVVGLAVLAGCVYVLPQVLVPDRSAASLATVSDAAKRLELDDARLKQRNDVRTTLLQGLAGAVVAVGLSLTWRQVRVSQEGQFYERFKTRSISWAATRSTCAWAASMRWSASPGIPTTTATRLPKF
jgi:hypothetical protein